MRMVVRKHEPHDVYIGRPSKWGNPFTHLKTPTQAQFICSSREESITKYEEWLMSQPDLVAAAKQELRGKVLACWCSPLACHGDVLVRIANGD